MAIHVNGVHVWEALKGEPVIVMACNTRNPLPIPGIMRAAQELDAVVAFELSKREIFLTNIEGLYEDGDKGLSGMDPKMYADIVNKYAKDFPNLVYFLHGDHIQIKSVTLSQISEAKRLIELELEAGFTSFGIDPSFVPIPENAAILTCLVIPIVQNGFGLEAEVGEIGKEEITTVEEATEYIERLKAAGITPNLLAINNGSKHGNYAPGEEVHINLKRTGEIYEATGIPIAQHGITGTPLHLVGQFADYGIRKGNVGTHWQNVLLDCVPGLRDKYVEWAEKKKEELELEKLGIEYANAVFLEETLNLPDEVKKKVADAAYETALEFFKAFRSEGTGEIVRKYIAKL
jgi:fructose-bisphosphate aldolase class II